MRKRISRLEEMMWKDRPFNGFHGKRFRPMDMINQVKEAVKQEAEAKEKFVKVVKANMAEAAWDD